MGTTWEEVSEPKGMTTVPALTWSDTALHLHSIPGLVPPPPPKHFSRNPRGGSRTCSPRARPVPLRAPFAAVVGHKHCLRAANGLTSHGPRLALPARLLWQTRMTVALPVEAARFHIGDIVDPDDVAKRVP